MFWQPEYTCQHFLHPENFSYVPWMRRLAELSGQTQSRPYRQTVGEFLLRKFFFRFARVVEAGEFSLRCVRAVGKGSILPRLGGCRGGTIEAGRAAVEGPFNTMELGMIIPTMAARLRNSIRLFAPRLDVSITGAVSWMSGICLVFTGVQRRERDARRKLRNAFLCKSECD